jgi:hypothetical protein
VSSLPPSQIVDVSCGFDHILVATSKGELLSCGTYSSGQLGLGEEKDQATPKVVSCLSHVKIIQISAGEEFSLALTAEGRVFSFGKNDSGQLGHGDTNLRRIPEEIKTIPVKLTSISTGCAHAMAVDENGDVWAWGRNFEGQLGLGHLINRLCPTRVFLPSKISRIACGGNFSGALSSKGQLYIWGTIPGSDDNQILPGPVPLPDEVSFFCCGHSHVMAITKDRRLFSWGLNTNGQLGLGDNKHRSTPELCTFDFGESLAAIGTSGDHSIAISEAGTIFTWGDNRYGQLGLRDKLGRAIPNLVQVSFHPIRGSISISSLLESAEFSDLIIFGRSVHSCIIHARCPRFLDLDLSPFQKPAVNSVISFIYTNSVNSFSDLSPEDFLELVLFARYLEFPGLLSIAQIRLVRSLTNENSYHMLSESIDLGLNDEMEWILWFIGKNKISPSLELLRKLSSESPIVFLRAFEQTTSLTLPPPEITDFPFPSLESDLEKLFSSGECSDFQISIGDTKLPLHKCLLSSWDYSKILFRSQTHSLQMPLETFRKILRFFYTQKISEISFSDAVYISAFADYYLLKDTSLFKFCSEKASQLDSSNWMDAFILGIELGNEELKEAAGKIASPNSLQMLEAVLEQNKAFKTKNEDLGKEVEGLGREVEGLRREIAEVKEENEKLKALTAL